jgi:hypothetical protein
MLTADDWGIKRSINGVHETWSVRASFSLGDAYMYLILEFRPRWIAD